MIREARANAPLIIASVVAVGAIVLFSFAFAWRASDQARISAIVAHNCADIEALKSQFRRQAIESFAALDRNGRLLGIRITPEVRAAARESRDRTLQRFRSKRCQT